MDLALQFHCRHRWVAEVLRKLLRASDFRCKTQLGQLLEDLLKSCGRNADQNTWQYINLSCSTCIPFIIGSHQDQCGQFLVSACNVSAHVDLRKEHTTTICILMFIYFLKEASLQILLLTLYEGIFDTSNGKCLLSKWPNTEDKHQVFANNLPKPLSDKFYSFSFWKMLKNYNLFINMFKESTFCCFQNFYIFSLRYISQIFHLSQLFPVLVIQFLPGKNLVSIFFFLSFYLTN